MGVGWVNRRWTTPQQLYLVSSVEKVLRLCNNNPQLKIWFFSFRSSNVEHCLTDYRIESALKFSWRRNVFSCCEVSNKIRTCSFIAFTDQFQCQVLLCKCLLPRYCQPNQCACCQAMDTKCLKILSRWGIMISSQDAGWCETICQHPKLL